MKSACLLLLVISASLSGCGSGSKAPRPPDPPASRFIHSPPVGGLNPTQLRALSMECEKYSPDGSSRGPYDIAYCDDAIAAWGDSPLQMVTVPQRVVTTPHSAIPTSRPANPVPTP